MITVIKVAILSPDAKINDQIKIDDELKAQIKRPIIEEVEEIKKKKTLKKVKKEK